MKETDKWADRMEFLFIALIIIDIFYVILRIFNVINTNILFWGVIPSLIARVGFGILVIIAIISIVLKNIIENHRDKN